MSIITVGRPFPHNISPQIVYRNIRRGLVRQTPTARNRDGDRRIERIHSFMSYERLESLAEFLINPISNRL